MKLYSLKGYEEAYAIKDDYTPITLDIDAPRAALLIYNDQIIIQLFKKIGGTYVAAYYSTDYIDNELKGGIINDLL